MSTPAGIFPPCSFSILALALFCNVGLAAPRWSPRPPSAVLDRCFAFPADRPVSFGAVRLDAAASGVCLWKQGNAYAGVTFPHREPRLVPPRIEPSVGDFEVLSYGGPACAGLCLDAVVESEDFPTRLKLSFRATALQNRLFVYGNNGLLLQSLELRNVPKR